LFHPADEVYKHLVWDLDRTITAIGFTCIPAYAAPCINIARLAVLCSSCHCDAWVAACMRNRKLLTLWFCLQGDGACFKIMLSLLELGRAKDSTRL
jgi:hypothetical protein